MDLAVHWGWITKRASEVPLNLVGRGEVELFEKFRGHGYALCRVKLPESFGFPRLKIVGVHAVGDEFIVCSRHDETNYGQIVRLDD